MRTVKAPVSLLILTLIFLLIDAISTEFSCIGSNDSWNIKINYHCEENVYRTNVESVMCKPNLPNRLNRFLTNEELYRLICA